MPNPPSPKPRRSLWDEHGMQRVRARFARWTCGRLLSGRLFVRPSTGRPRAALCCSPMPMRRLRLWQGPLRGELAMTAPMTPSTLRVLAEEVADKIQYPLEPRKTVTQIASIIESALKRAAMAEEGAAIFQGK